MQSNPTDQELDFKECDACGSKPGSPLLCAGCRHNRKAMEIMRSAAPIAPRKCLVLDAPDFRCEVAGETWAAVGAGLMKISAVLQAAGHVSQE